MDYETLRNSMTVQDAVRVLKETNCCGTMDIAKNVILKALEQQPSEGEKVIRISKGTLKVRTGRYVIYDVEWLKEHYNTTEAKIYGQPSEDCIRRSDASLTNLEILMSNGDYKEALKMLLDKIEKAPSVTPQPKEEPQPKTGHWILSGGYWRCSECKEKALLKLDKATGGYREYEPVRSKYCPECGAKMQEEKK